MLSIKEEPLVSVIVPIFHVDLFLREALNSIIHQTYKNLEIILIDDGSTDKSEEIMEEYGKDRRVRIFHQQNLGVSAARNTGLNCMTGEIVAFLDPDDKFHPDFIQIMVEIY